MKTAQLELVPTQFGANFGIDVSVLGDRILVGAVSADSPAGNDTGAAFLFEYVGGVWQQTVMFHPPLEDPKKNFGNAVHLDGDRAIVGSPGASPLMGLAFVYREVGGTWTTEGMLTQPGGSPWDKFGSSVRLDGDHAAVSAREHDFLGMANPGAVYLYRFVGGSWTLVSKVTAGHHAQQSAQFGDSMDLRSGRLLVAAPVEAVEGVNNAGALYLFAFDGEQWYETSRWTAQSPIWNEKFGTHACLTKDFAWIPRPNVATTTQEHVQVLSLGCDPWIDFQQGHAGTAGVPKLTGTGLLLPTASSTVEVSNALPNAPGTLFVVAGDTPVPATHACATIVAWPPTTTLFFTTDAAGRYETSAVLPLHTVGQHVMMQAAITDPGANCGVAVTNALQATLETPWFDLGGAHAGVQGDPLLTASGLLDANAVSSITLSNAAANAPAALFLAPGPPKHEPFACTTSMAYPPSHAVFFTTDALGGTSTSDVVPTGLSGLEIVLQAAIVDPAASCGVALSNALRGRFP